MRVPWDCMLSEMIKIQNRYTNDSTNKGNVKPTMLSLKKKKYISTSGDAAILNESFSLVLCQSSKRASILESTYITRIYKHRYRVSGFVFNVIKQ